MHILISIALHELISQANACEHCEIAYIEEFLKKRTYQFQIWSEPTSRYFHAVILLNLNVIL